LRDETRCLKAVLIWVRHRSEGRGRSEAERRDQLGAGTEGL
jgi:hypothetical protein